MKVTITAVTAAKTGWEEIKPCMMIMSCFDGAVSGAAWFSLHGKRVHGVWAFPLFRGELGELVYV